MEVDQDVVHLHVLVQGQLQVPAQQEEGGGRLSEGAGGGKVRARGGGVTTYSRRRRWLSWWDGGKQQLLNTTNFLPKLSSPGEQVGGQHHWPSSRGQHT